MLSQQTTDKIFEHIRVYTELYSKIVFTYIASEIYKSRRWILSVSNEGQYKTNSSNKERGKEKSSVDLETKMQ